MTITHERCQAALAEGRPYEDAVDDHAATCDGCAAFARALDRLDRATLSYASGRVPDGLAERIINMLALDEAHRPVRRYGGATGSSGTRRFLTRSIVIRSVVAAAAVVAIVLASLVTINRGEQDNERMVLISAARDLEEGGPARVDVEAAAEFSAAVGADGRPRYDQVPPEVRPYLEAEWARMIAAFERQAAELEGRIEEMLTESERRMNEMLGQTPGMRPGPGAPPRQPSAGAEEPVEPATPDDRRESAEPTDPGAPPRKASLGVRIVAGGAVDFSGRATLEGTVTPVSGTVEAPATTAPFAVAVGGEARAVQGPDGAWSRVEDNVDAPLAQILLDARIVPRLLRSAEGDVEATATTTAADGSRVRTYRFTSEHEGDRWHVDVAIGVDGRVRTATLTPVTTTRAGSALTIRMAVGPPGEVERHATHAEASASVAAAAAPVTADAGSEAVYPIGSAVRAAFEGSQE